MNMSDIIMEVFAMESSLLQSRNNWRPAGAERTRSDACAVYLRDAIGKYRTSGQERGAERLFPGRELRWNLSGLRAYGLTTGEFDRTAGARLRGGCWPAKSIRFEGKTPVIRSESRNKALLGRTRARGTGLC